MERKLSHKIQLASELVCVFPYTCTDMHVHACSCVCVGKVINLMRSHQCDMNFMCMGTEPEWQRTFLMFIS